MAEYTPAELLDLTDDAFGEIVEGDLRNKLDPATAVALGSITVVHRWRSQLEQMSEHSMLIMKAKDAETEAEQIEHNLAGHPDQAETTRAKNLRLRASTFRFQAILRHKTIHVEGLIAAYGRSSNNQATQLAQAVIEHRNAMANGVANQADRRLWEVLEDIQTRSAVRSR